MDEISKGYGWSIWATENDSAGPWPLRLLVAAALGLSILLVPVGASAHIVNEKAVFSDIAQAEARNGIVALVAVGMIPETPDFAPDSSLTRKDLAAWAALAGGISQGTDIDALAGAALDGGLVSSIDGDASLGEVAQVLLASAVVPDNADAVPTKGEAAHLVAANLADVEIGGVNLFEAAGLREGPAGEITDIEMKTTETGGTAYFVTIADVTLAFYAHGLVADGPTDIAAWKGHAVARSLIRVGETGEVWIFLQAAEPIDSSGEEGHGHSHHH